MVSPVVVFKMVKYMFGPQYICSTFFLAKQMSKCFSNLLHQPFIFVKTSCLSQNRLTITSTNSRQRCRNISLIKRKSGKDEVKKDVCMKGERAGSTNSSMTTMATFQNDSSLLMHRSLQVRPPWHHPVTTRRKLQCLDSRHQIELPMEPKPARGSKGVSRILRMQVHHDMAFQHDGPSRSTGAMPNFQTRA